MGFKPAPASMPPVIHPPTSSSGHSGGRCLPLELPGFSRLQDLHLGQGLEVGPFSFVHAIGLNWLFYRDA